MQIKEDSIILDVKLAQLKAAYTQEKEQKAKME